MAHSNLQIVQSPNVEVMPDYADYLYPGYRFCPTDSELILYYLKPKIECRSSPPCRLYEVYLYDYKPDELAELFRPIENKWYFLTSRQRKYPRGKRPRRDTRDNGFWKTTQKATMVYDEVMNGQVVGYKRNLAYFDGNKRKTSWLMHEYTTNHPDLPFGSGQNGNELNTWVLCKIYKKETTANGTANDNRGEELVRNMTNQGDLQVIDEQNQHHDEPLQRQTGVSLNHDNVQPNEPDNGVIQDDDLATYAALLELLLS